MAKSLELTVGSAFGCRSLSSSTTNTYAVDDITLLGLVAQTTGFIRARWTRSAVDDVQLSKLYSCTLSNVQRVYSKTQQVPRDFPQPCVGLCGAFLIEGRERAILLPSIGRAAGNAGRRIASSFEALRHLQ